MTLKHLYIRSEFCRSKSGHRVLYSLKSRCQLGCVPIWRSESYSELTWLWQKSLSCGHKTKVPISLLAVSQRSLSAPRGHLYSLPCGPPHLQNQKQRVSFTQNSSHTSNPSHLDPCPF